VGDLTIRDVTRPVTLEVTFGGAVTDPFGNNKVLFAAEGELDREDWGITWNAPLEAGGVLIGKKIKLELEVQAVAG
jgi:polyisoprenoid-binding protein YceI